MSGEEWADEPEVPKKKRGLPTWLWFCGGGCLIAVVLAAIGAFFMVDRFKSAIDQDQQWENLSALIEMDAQPEGWMIVSMDFVPMMPFDGFVFTDSAQRTFNLMIMPASQAAEMEEMFSEDFDGGGVPGLNSVEEVIQGTIEIQGREYRIARFSQDVIMQGTQHGAFLDITPEGSDEFWLLQALVPEKFGEVSDEYLRDFLAPFHVGPDHVPYVAEHAETEIKAAIEAPPEEVFEESAAEEDSGDGDSE